MSRWRPQSYNPVVRFATAFALGAAVIGLSACGGSHRARPPEYSVRQVEKAFAAHGLRLHQARFGPALGVVKLLRPGVEVDVARGSKSVSWVSVAPTGERSRGKQNLIVTWKPRYTRSVSAALRQLKQ